MKVAIVHDELIRRGGGEQVVLTMLKAFPDAHLYTSCYNPDKTYPEFKKYSIKTSLFGGLAKNERLLKLLFFPFGLLAMKFLKVKGYDIVIISNTYCAKYVSISDSSKIFIYTYTPFRLAWNPTSYEEYNKSKGIKRMLYDQVVAILKKIDKKAASKGNYFLGMTQETAERIRQAYDVRDVKIIPPAVKCENFYIGKTVSNYYLLVSRLEFYKKVDLAVKAFNELGHRLIVVGNGSKKEYLKSIAKSNIEFKNSLSKEEIATLYANCKAFIFPQHEDYGITPLEANASGRPIIAYAKGGVLETMVPYNGVDSDFTAVFFNDQTVDSLIKGISLFEQIAPKVQSEFIRKHAEKFDESVFIKKFIDYVNERIQV
jgi:glycosyltransferase involved in cell wall biosynthesis